MTYFRPAPSPSRFALAALPLLSIAVAFWLFGTLSARLAVYDFDPGVYLLGLGLFLALFLAGMSAYLAWCLFTIGYALESRYLTLRCGGVRYEIPLDSITAVYGQGGMFRDRPIAVRWQPATALIPGYVVGNGNSRLAGRVLAVATRPAAMQLLVVTPGLSYGLSPEDASGFTHRLEERRDAIAAGYAGSASADKQDGPKVLLSGMSAWGAYLWSDALSRAMLLAGLAICALLFAYMSIVYGNLPERLALHWNSQAQVDRIGSPSELVRLPAIALGLWFANVIAAWVVGRRERAATIFLLAGGVAVPVVFAAGALSIVMRV